MKKYVKCVYLPVSCIYRSIQLTKRKMFPSWWTSVTIPNGEMLVTKYKQKSDHFRCVDNGGAGTTPLDVGHCYKLWYGHGHGYGLIFILTWQKKCKKYYFLSNAWFNNLFAFYECKLCKSI